MSGLAAGFRAFSEEDWRKLAGEMPVSLSADGLRIGPIYSADRGEALRGRPGGMAWRVASRVASNEGLHDAIASDIAGGVGDLEFTFTTSPLAMGEGLRSLNDLQAALKDVNLSGIQIRVDAGEESASITTALRMDKRAAGVTVAFDPIATLAARGRLTLGFEEIGSEIVRMAGVGGPDPVVIGDGRIWHAGGASEAEELAAVLAAVAEYLRLFEKAPLPVNPALTGVALAADADQFLTIAKFRAMRLLHARLLEAAEVPAAICKVHAETSWRMLSRIDPHSNILRTTGAVFSAAVGGADSITALPFDAAIGSNDPFARRIARNSQTILIDEVGLARVADAGAGSGAIETLTRSLAEAAWNRFRSIEKEGGLLAAVQSGAIQRLIAETRDQRLARVRNSEIQIVGANAFRDASGKTRPESPAGGGADAGVAAAATVEPLRFTRLSESFES